VRVLRSIDDLRPAILERRVAGDAVGFVPTMGSVHDGHLSLVRRSRAENGCTVVSIFVNPRQLSGSDEVAHYPRDEARDLALLEREGAELCFAPALETIYPPNDATRVVVDRLTERLEGASRPGTMDGLTTVLLKLIHLVGPARLYLGQKDAQRVVVLRRMLRDLFVNVDLVVCPTVRELDGLAVSSHNAMLSIEERHAAPCLHAALKAAQHAYDAGERSAEVLRARMHDVLAREPSARIDYVSIADAETLAELGRVSGPALALVAARIGRVRLTDALPLAWDVA
jgi:pantoate--beta-alanine ligase